jgi:hypothetical protein
LRPPEAFGRRGGYCSRPFPSSGLAPFIGANLRCSSCISPEMPVAIEKVLIQHGIMLHRDKKESEYLE